MKGFTDKALLLFPSLENYSGRSASYKYQFSAALNNLVQYLQNRGIQIHVFYTDDVARELRHGSFTWVSPVGKQELFFMKRYCDNCIDAMETPTVFYDNEYNKVLDKVPLDITQNNESRFSGMLKRISKMQNIIIKDYKAVFHFYIPNRKQYTVKAKEGDGRILAEINASNFLVKTFMNGTEFNPIDLFGIECASRGLDVWTGGEDI